MSIVNMGFHTTCDSPTGGGSQMLTVFPPALEVAKCPLFPTNATRCFVSDVFCDKEIFESMIRAYYVDLHLYRVTTVGIEYPARITTL
jgi:hypothetical protein